MFLIVGLGNPGAEYAKTRHNAGFMAADAIASAYGFSPFREKFDGLVAEGNIAGEKAFLLKPQTFMNLSGDSVLKAAHFYKILPPNIVVIHDDIDLALGRVKAKVGGGTGGHNGLKSIDARIGRDYARVRIGVGRGAADGQGSAGRDAAAHVLGAFSKADGKVLDSAISAVAERIGVLLEDGIDRFSTDLGMALAANFVSK